MLAKIYNKIFNIREDGIKIPKYKKGKLYFFDSIYSSYKMLFENNSWKLFKKEESNSTWKLINESADVRNMAEIEGVKLTSFNIVQYY